MPNFDTVWAIGMTLTMGAWIAALLLKGEA
jgi:hypothetical protein